MSSRSDDVTPGSSWPPEVPNTVAFMSGSRGRGGGWSTWLGAAMGAASFLR